MQIGILNVKPNLSKSLDFHGVQIYVPNRKRVAYQKNIFVACGAEFLGYRDSFIEF